MIIRTRPTFDYLEGASKGKPTNAKSQKIAQKISEPPGYLQDDPPAKPEKLDVPKLRKQIAAIPANPETAKAKHLVSIRYDEKVLVFFRAKGKGWQRLMNEVLLAYVEDHKEPLK